MKTKLSQAIYLASSYLFVVLFGIHTSHAQYSISLENPNITGHDSISVIFNDDDPVNNFYTDNQDSLFLYVRYRGCGNIDWQGDGPSCGAVDSSAILIKQPNGSYTGKFLLEDYLYNFDPSNTDVFGLNIIVFNKFDCNGNNKTSNLYLPLYLTQSISTSITPTTPTDEDLITINFDATGTQLEGEDKIYLHAGVSLSPSTPRSFERTTGVWGADNGVGLMTQNTGDPNQWSIQFNMRDYFNLDDFEDSHGLNYLFRNAGGTIQYKDTCAQDYHNPVEPGVYLNVNTPTNDIVFEEINNQVTWNIDVLNGNADTVKLYESDSLGGFVNGIEENGGSITNFTRSITIADALTRYYTVEFVIGTEIKKKTYLVKGITPTQTASLPAGIDQPGIHYHDNDDTKVTFVLHLPTTTQQVNGDGDVYSTVTTAPKQSVYMLGDFNNWQIDENYRLQRDGDMWWITIDNLVPGKEYVCQYLVDGLFRIADPYSEKISDPDDAGIPESIYPNLIEYPFNKTEKRATVIQTAQEEYVWQYSDNFTPVDQNKLVIYELLFRDFTEEGTYLAAIDKLDYIKNLGVNCIHVMPVSEFEGNSSWGYNPNFYFAADKYYGTANDLKKFIDEAHRRGIAVVNDLVLNHAFKSHPMVRLYSDDPNIGDVTPSHDNPWFNREHRRIYNRAGHWGADWNHESEHTRAYLDRAIDHWLTEFKFDGYRFDFTKGISQSPQDPNDPWASNYDVFRVKLLKRMVDQMWANHPDSYVIFEHLANAPEDNELSNHGKGILMWSGVGPQKPYMSLAKGWDQDGNFGFWSSVWRENYNKPHLISYKESHDEERIAYEVMQYGKSVRDSTGQAKIREMSKRIQLISLFNAFLEGPRMIWQFEELGYDFSINYNGRTGEKPVRWDYFLDEDRRKIYDLYSMVFNIRDSLLNGEYLTDYGNIGYPYDLSQVRYMVATGSGGEKLIIAGNFDPDNVNTFSPPYGNTSPATWHRRSSKSIVDNTNFVAVDGNTYDLDPGEWIILSSIAIPDPIFVPERPELVTVDTLAGRYDSVLVSVDLNLTNDSMILLCNTVNQFDFPDMNTMAIGDTTTNGSVILSTDDKPISPYSHSLDIAQGDTIYYAAYSIKDGVPSTDPRIVSYVIPRCPDNYSLATDKEYSASAQLSVTSVANLEANTAVEYISQEIYLNPDFCVPTGTTLDIIIDDCLNYNFD